MCETHAVYNVHDAGLLPRGYFPIFMPLLDGSVKMCYPKILEI